MIEEGKDKIEWYRQVDPAKLNTLKELVAAPNYKVNNCVDRSMEVKLSALLGPYDRQINRPSNRILLLLAGVLVPRRRQPSRRLFLRMTHTCIHYILQGVH